ncbi:unnamed protein product [Sphagnum balticum]
MMERALLRLLRSHALRASCISSSSCFLQGGAVPRRLQHVRALVSASSLGNALKARNILQGLLVFSQPIWEAWNRGFADVSGGPGDIVVPFMGDSVPDGVIAAILKKPGDAVAVDEIVAQIETDKVTIDVRSPVAGKIELVTAKEGDTVTPGTKVANVAVGEAGAMSVPSPPPPKEEKVAPPPEPAAPAPQPPPQAPPKTPEKVPPAPAASQGQSPTEVHLPPKGGERRIPMTRLRKRVATRLKDSQNTFALLTTFNEIDMTNLMDMRAEYKDAFQEKHGVKLGFMSGFVKVAVSALQQLPSVNAVIDGDDIIYRDYVDISIAVGTAKGLVVPVIRGADHMNFAQIEKTINTLGKKANDGSISIDDMAGGTFTISNGGVYGSLISTPIINPPQSAILGMHSIQKRPVVIGTNIVVRPMMYVALTYDHRLIDGREAVLFLRAVKDKVEDPRRLLLDL